MRRPDPAASVAVLPAAVAAAAAMCVAYVLAAVFAFIALGLAAVFWNTGHQPARDDLDALIEATREPHVIFGPLVPDFVPAEWVKEAGR